MQRMMAMEGFILLVLRAPSGTPGEWLLSFAIISLSEDNFSFMYIFFPQIAPSRHFQKCGQLGLSEVFAILVGNNQDKCFISSFLGGGSNIRKKNMNV